MFWELVIAALVEITSIVGNMVLECTFILKRRVIRIQYDGQEPSPIHKFIDFTAVLTNVGLQKQRSDSMFKGNKDPRPYPHHSNCAMCWIQVPSYTLLNCATCDTISDLNLYMWRSSGHQRIRNFQKMETSDFSYPGSFMSNCHLNKTS